MREHDEGQTPKVEATMSKTQDTDHPALDTSTLERLRSVWTEVPSDGYNDPEHTNLFLAPPVLVGKSTSGLLALDANDGHLTATIQCGGDAREALDVGSLDELKLVRAVIDSLIQQWTDAIPEHA